MFVFGSVLILNMDLVLVEVCVIGLSFAKLRNVFRAMRIENWKRIDVFESRFVRVKITKSFWCFFLIFGRISEGFFN